MARIVWPNGLVRSEFDLKVDSLGKKLAHVRVGNILLDHALRVEERSVDRDSVLHDAEITVALVVKHRNYYAF